MNEYDKAIERLKQWDREHENAGYIISDRDKFIFPELAESEDERIRKKILELVSISGNGNDWEEINAWLEKQKEQKPAERSEGIPSLPPKPQTTNRCLFGGLCTNPLRICAGCPYNTYTTSITIDNTNTK